MAKKKKDTMVGITMSGIMASNVVGAMPSSGMAGETALRSDFSEGIGNVGKTLPVMGKVKGTKMVMKSTGKLLPKTKKLFKKLKGGKKNHDII